MIYPPLIFVLMVAFFFLTLIFLPLLWFGVVGSAFANLGLSPTMVFWLLILTLVGSLVNIPLTTLESQEVVAQQEITYFGMRVRLPPARLRQQTVLAVNLGGALIPAALSLYLLFKIIAKIGLPWGLLAVLGIVTMVMYYVARPSGVWALRSRGLSPPFWPPWEPGSYAPGNFGPPAPISLAPWGSSSAPIS